LGQRAAIYCRVSTADQSCARQERDLTAFAARAGYDVVGIFKETGSGAKIDRVERKKIMALAQARQIDVVLVAELSRWGRSTLDLLHTLKELEARRLPPRVCATENSFARAIPVPKTPRAGPCSPRLAKWLLGIKLPRARPCVFVSKLPKGRPGEFVLMVACNVA